jgi:hypothetical protein
LLKVALNTITLTHLFRSGVMPLSTLTWSCCICVLWTHPWILNVKEKKIIWRSI